MNNITLSAKHGDDIVRLNVTDLDAFIHASPDDHVVVYSGEPGVDESASEVPKRELQGFAFES